MRSASIVRKAGLVTMCVESFLYVIEVRHILTKRYHVEESLSMQVVSICGTYYENTKEVITSRPTTIPPLDSMEWGIIVCW